jgi:bifunctional ADP-heptose synthase (sugar kinase/adenylyltransferase)
LKEARSLGDRLVVSVTSAPWVLARKGNGHPAHTDRERLEQLLDLRFVDEVYLCRADYAAPAILAVKPKIYVKGVDYVERGHCLEDQLACKEVGAKIVYTRSEKRSVTDMIRKFQ